MPISLKRIAARSAGPGVAALLLALAAQAAAQAPAPLDRIGQARWEHERDLQALEVFAGRRRAEGARALGRPGPWTLYGRLGLLHFQNHLDTQEGATRFTLRRTGPGLGTKIYVGIHRRF